MATQYKVRLTVEQHDPSDEYSDEDPTALALLVEGRDEQDAEGAARDKAHRWVQVNWGDVGYIVTVIHTEEVRA